MYLTKQQIFDTVLTKLREQGRASMQGTGCAYRGEGGLKCAVGHLMPDNAYDPAYEGLDAGTLPQEAYAAMNVSYTDIGFLCQLQEAHDYPLQGEAQDHQLGSSARGSGPVAWWEAEMEEIAAQHNLIYTPVEVQQ